MIKAYFIGGCQDLTVRMLTDSEAQRTLQFAKTPPTRPTYAPQDGMSVAQTFEIETYERLGGLRHDRNTYVYELVRS